MPVSPAVDTRLLESFAELVAFRRDLHAHPELGYHEHRTAERVAERLRAAGYEVTTHIAATGVVAVLEGARDGSTRAWRADMDALPIAEGNRVDYRSTCDGVMHACGHDVHTTIGLGLALEVARRRAELAGRVVFVFQPNEEGAPGAGPSGGDAMVAEAVLERFGIEAMLGLHCLPGLDVGMIGYRYGALWAGSDRFVATVRGRGTHGAYPHLGVDPIVAAAQWISAVQTIPSRLVDAQHACVLSVCQVHAGTQFNAIPEQARLEGILRTLEDDVRERAVSALERLSAGIAQATGTEIALEVHRGAEITASDDGLLERALVLLRDAAGEAALHTVPAQMGAEDFAAFSRRVPSAYFMLGIRGDGKGEAPLHSPHFDVDERCIAVAVPAMAAVLLGL